MGQNRLRSVPTVTHSLDAAVRIMHRKLHRSATLIVTIAASDPSAVSSNTPLSADVPERSYGAFTNKRQLPGG